MRLLAAVAAIVLATSALANEPIHVYPLGPTTKTPVEVHYLSICHPRGHTVEMGEVIRITALDPNCVIVLPIPMLQTVRLPQLLSAGEYAWKCGWRATSSRPSRRRSSYATPSRATSTPSRCREA